MKRHTQIICTIGPASARKATLLKMYEAGMNVVRLNFSHGNHTYHQELINLVREVNLENKIHIKILQDLEGYRIRLGQLDKPMDLMKHQIVWLTDKSITTKDHIPLESDTEIHAIKVGMNIYINDGLVHARVIEEEKDRVKLEVIQGGIISSRKGVNIPELKLTANILTDKDRRDVEFGLKNNVDFMALSFARNKSDVIRLSKIVKPVLPNCQIIAKIENGQGLNNLDQIIQVSDGVMVARGDLGVQMPIFQVPIMQKDIIRRCNIAKKPVITATQMLESMAVTSRPTRAEVSDVANAILDGTDYVMLSAETAVGCYPVKTVRMMHQIITYTEQSQKLLGSKSYLSSGRDLMRSAKKY